MLLLFRLNLLSQALAGLATLWPLAGFSQSAHPGVWMNQPLAGAATVWPQPTQPQGYPGAKMAMPLARIAQRYPI